MNKKKLYHLHILFSLQFSFRALNIDVRSITDNDTLRNRHVVNSVQRHHFSRWQHCNVGLAVLDLPNGPRQSRGNGEQTQQENQ